MGGYFGCKDQWIFLINTRKGLVVLRNSREKNILKWPLAIISISSLHFTFDNDLALKLCISWVILSLLSQLSDQTNHSLLCPYFSIYSFYLLIIQLIDNHSMTYDFFHSSSFSSSASYCLYSNLQEGAIPLTSVFLIWAEFFELRLLHYHWQAYGLLIFKSYA